MAKWADRWMGRGSRVRAVGEGLAAIWGGMSLSQALDHVAAIRGDEVAVVVEEPLSVAGFEMSTWTYRDLARFVGRASTALFVRGRVREGDVVVVCTGNQLDMPLLTLAVSRCGAVAVPLNHHLSAEELRFIAQDSGAGVVVVDEEVFERVVAPMIAQGMPSGLDRIAIAGSWSGPEVEGVEVVGLWAWMGEERAVEARPMSDEGVCAVFYTSGTTGFPKGAMLTSRSLLSDLRFLLGLPTLMPQTMLVALPMAHIMGFSTFLMGLMAGVRMIYLARFSPERVLDWMESGEVDGFLGVPSMYQMLEEAGGLERDLRGVRVFASAADVMPGALMERFKAAGRLLELGGVSVPAVFVEAYGSVELSGAAMIRVSLPWMSPSEGGFVGWPLPSYRVRIVGEGGRVLGAGEVGELQVQGTGVLKGYLGREAATREAIEGDGWLRTGERASRGRLGVVRFGGGEMELIMRGGYSVFPAEIETQFLLHPSVVKVAVVGVGHGSKGAVPVAVVCVEPGSEVDEEALRRWIGGRVSRYKAPRRVVIIEESQMPYGPTGKIVKRALVERLEGMGIGG